MQYVSVAGLFHHNACPDDQCALAVTGQSSLEAGTGSSGCLQAPRGTSAKDEGQLRQGCSLPPSGKMSIPFVVRFECHS